MFSRAMSRILGLCALFLVMGGAPWPVVAAEFEGTSSAWDGLLDFVDLAASEGVELQETKELLWSAVGAEDVLVIVYPERELDLESLSEFVIDGGRVVLFDDFGESEGFLGRLSLVRQQPEPEDLPHDRFIDGEYDWPVFRPRGRHPLLVGVEEIVANHPSVLHNVGGPVVAYDHGGGLVYDMMLGEGRVVVVADSSIPINSMVGVADNRRLMANIFQYICPMAAQGCGGWLVAGDFQTVGGYGAPPLLRGDGSQGTIQELNRRIQDIFSKLPQTELLFYLAIFLAVGTAAYWVTVFPFHRGRRWSAVMDRRAQELAGPLTEFDWNLARFSEAKKGLDFALPLAVLKEEFGELFLEGLGLWPLPSGGWPKPEELGRRFEERYLRGFSPKVRQERRRVVERLWGQLQRVPDRGEIYLERRRRWSARDLRRIHQQVVDILGWMGLEERYERRKREVGFGRGVRGPGEWDSGSKT